MEEKEKKEIKNYYDYLFICEMCNRFDGFCDLCPDKVENLLEDHEIIDNYNKNID